MIRHTRKARISQGHAAEAYEQAVAITAKVSEITGTEWHVFQQFGGPIRMLHWMGDYETLADMEEAWARIGQDESYLHMEQSMLKLLVEGTVEDTLMMSL